MSSKENGISGGDWEVRCNLISTADGTTLSCVNTIGISEWKNNAKLFAAAGTAANKLTAKGFNGPECVARLVELVELVDEIMTSSHYRGISHKGNLLLSQLKED